MNIQENGSNLLRLPDPFVKYGIRFTTHNDFLGPLSPPCHSQTPSLTLDPKTDIDFEPEAAFLRKSILGRFSFDYDRDRLLAVVGKVFQSATGKSMEEYAKKFLCRLKIGKGLPGKLPLIVPQLMVSILEG